MQIYNWKFEFNMSHLLSSTVEFEFKVEFLRQVKKDYIPELEPIIGKHME